MLIKTRIYAAPAVKRLYVTSCIFIPVTVNISLFPPSRFLHCFFAALYHALELWKYCPLKANGSNFKSKHSLSFIYAQKKDTLPFFIIIHIVNLVFYQHQTVTSSFSKCFIHILFVSLFNSFSIVCCDNVWPLGFFLCFR